MRWLTLLILCFFLSPLAHAQSKSELEMQRENIESEIEVIGQRLQKTRENRKEALNNYLALQRKIQKRTELISTLEQEKKHLIKRMNRTEEVINSLEEDASVLEQEYGVILRQALRQKLGDSYISFIFSAKDFNEALKRWRYLNQYRAYRSRQTQVIKETKRSLIKKQQTLRKLSLKKEKLISEQVYQQEQHNTESKNRNAMYQSLKKDEKNLRAELKEQQEVAYQLKNAILDLISDSPSKIAVKSNTDITADFSSAKATLDWPVKDGLVVRYFGKQQHPTIKRIEVNNNGIDILTSTSTSVFASFAGIVAGQFVLPNGKKSILVKHGEFYTVYSNLDQAFVKKDDKVSPGQQIGDLGPIDNTLHFEIWRRKVRLNPIDWLNPR